MSTEQNANIVMRYDVFENLFEAKLVYKTIVPIDVPL